jgi:branched-chain amino acid transport system ATP-binding protein
MTSLLEVHQLTRRFGGLVAVNNMNFAVHGGEIVGLLGPNGSGKTTVMNLISGALTPTSGAIHLDGQVVSSLAPHVISRRGVARTFQLVRVLGSMSCLENVTAGLAFCKKPKWGREAERSAMTLLARVGLAERAMTSAGELTYINQKKLELARALAAQPRLLLLDEWLAGLNPTELLEGIELLKQLREDGVTMLMVEHVMDAIRALCNRVIVMNAGIKIADAEPQVALADAHVIRAYLGEEDA